MSKLSTDVRKARPHLFVVSPLAFWVICCFAFYNLWAGYGLYIVPMVALPPVMGEVLTNHVYAYAFWFVAAGLIWSLLSKRWWWTQRFMFIGLFLKAVFLYGLIALVDSSKPGQSWENLAGIVGLWAFIVLIQMGAIFFFSPPGLGKETDDGSTF